jgi:hypothetical protein
MKRHLRINRLDGIWLEFKVASTATGLLEERLSREPSFGDLEGWRFRDAIRWRNHLEPTFLIRMYAEFEVSLRDVWKNHFGQVTHPSMKDLLVAIAARIRVPNDRFEAMDRLRVYRNGLVHSGKEPAFSIPMQEARSTMKAFLSWLPVNW